MSSIGMLGTAALEALFSRTSHSSVDKFKQTFQQLGQDLQAGNVKQAEADLAVLQPNVFSNQSSTSSTSSTSSGTVSQAFNQMAQDLQTGNLSAAQSDYATLQQNLQQGVPSQRRYHLHGAASHAEGAQTQELLAQLGQALQSGNLSAAQQAYATLQTDLPSAMLGGPANNSIASAFAGSNVNLSA